MKKIAVAALTALAFGIAAPSAVQAAQPSQQQLFKNEELRLVEVAGKERMLSQAIAKDYLYAWQGVAADKASRAMKNEMKEFSDNLGKLRKMINDPEIENLIEFVQMSYEELQQVLKEEPNSENAQIVLDLTESMLEGSQYITDTLKQKVNIKEMKVIDTAGIQRMLAQRIAKYYIAYQAGIKDKNTVDQMNRTVKEFTENQKELMRNPDNPATINKMLSEVDRLWKVVYKFYLNIEKGGLPFIVYKTTDDITKKMDQVTKAYIQLYEGRK